jgi:hypothetical protein
MGYNQDVIPNTNFSDAVKMVDTHVYQPALASVKHEIGHYRTNMGFSFDTGSKRYAYQLKTKASVKLAIVETSKLLFKSNLKRMFKPLNNQTLESRIFELELIKAELMAFYLTLDPTYVE